MIEVLYTDEFDAWWDSLTGEEQESVAHDVNILRVEGGAAFVFRVARASPPASTTICANCGFSTKGVHTVCCTRSTLIAQPFC
jgi:hypothetical protein